MIVDSDFAEWCCASRGDGCDGCRLPLGCAVGTEPEQHQPRFLRCSFSAAFAAASASSLREAEHAFVSRKERLQTRFNKCPSQQLELAFWLWLWIQTKSKATPKATITATMNERKQGGQAFARYRAAAATLARSHSPAEAWITAK